MSWFRDYWMAQNAAQFEAAAAQVRRNQEIIAQQRADYERHVRNHSFDDGTVIEGTFTVVEETKMLEGK